MSNRAAAAPELTKLGLVSRLEYMLDRFEAELAERRRALAEAQARLAGYEQRLGEAITPPPVCTTPATAPAPSPPRSVVRVKRSGAGFGKASGMPASGQG